MLFKRAFIVNLGGTAEVVISDFCPFTGQKSFLFYKNCLKTVGQIRFDNINLSARFACRGTRLTKGWCKSYD